MEIKEEIKHHNKRGEPQWAQGCRKAKTEKEKRKELSWQNVNTDQGIGRGKEKGWR
jgi:hypothetical protein